MGRIGKKLISALPDLWVTKKVNGEPVSKPQKLGAGELSGFFSDQHNSDKSKPRLRFNEMTLMPELDGETVPVPEAELLYVQVSKKGGDISQKHAQDALRDAALDHSFDPVKEYLIGVRDNPDIKPADITQLSTHFLGVDDELSNRQLAMCAIGAVRRVFQPGCKHDTCLVLHSEEQGKNKSTFWNRLASDSFFNDTGQRNDKDFLLAAHSCWIYELAEIETVTSNQAIGALRQLLSSKKDLFRAPYAAAVDEHKRRGIFVGSVNKTDFLRDPYGTRRWHVIPLPRGHSIPLERLDNGGRDSFWKAAILAMEKGEKNHLSKDWEELSEARNVAFKEELLYEGRFAAWLSGSLKFQGQPWNGQPFTTDDALHFSGCRDRGSIEEKHKRAAADALRSLGFKYTLKRIGGFRIWVWVSSDHRHLGGKKSSEKPEAQNDEGLNPSDDATQEQG